MTLLARLAEASERVGATSARLAKVRELAGLLRQLGPEEIRIGVQYLAGETPQGRVGIGQAVLRDGAAGVNYGASDPRKDGAAIPEPIGS